MSTMINIENSIGEVTIFPIHIENVDKQLSKEFFVSQKSQKYITQNPDFFNHVLYPEASTQTLSTINYDDFRGNKN